jgi:hypothetical protein
MKIPENLTGKELFDFLVKNKSLLEKAKKEEIKRADVIPVLSRYKVTEKGDVVKSDSTTGEPVPETAASLDAVLIINTTNLMDSHSDVHIPGLWKKSLQENKEFYHLQEHQMEFDKVISDTAKAMTKKYSWRDLGYDVDGVTEALVFISKIERERNEFMFDQYRKGYVKNHSVGMRYVRLKMCINSEDYPEEYANWTEYIDEVINRDLAEAKGYFWAVLEAKIIEGSAVVRGSNWITPTQSITASTKSESTEQRPSEDTGEQPHEFDLDKAIKEFKLFN